MRLRGRDLAALQHQHRVRQSQYDPDARRGSGQIAWHGKSSALVAGPEILSRLPGVKRPTGGQGVVLDVSLAAPS